jgi:hypothetical protein
MLYHHEDNELRAKCLRWFTRARALHAAKPALVAAVLEAAAALLPSRVDNNRNALECVLRHAAAALCTAHQLHPHTRRPLPCI